VIEATQDSQVRKKSDTSEPEKMMSFRCPESLRSYLQAQPEGITATILESVELKRDLDKALKDLNKELIQAAAALGLEYSFAQAETIASIVRGVLAPDDKQTKPEPKKFHR
jgi:hypothetical protein